jgi:hypothetical protein
MKMNRFFALCLIFVPLCTSWNQNPLHKKLSWNNEKERLALHRDKGWDTVSSVYPAVTPASVVEAERRFETEGDMKVLYQTWKTPAGNVTEKLKVTEDWGELERNPGYMGFMSDFRPSRYIEFPFKDEKDLDTLEYLFPLENPADTEAITREFKEKRKLADEFGFALQTYFDAGMDWLMWLYPAEEAVMRVMDEPRYMKKLLSHINKAKTRRLELLLDLGIDFVRRRGWYESADFWSPQIFREFIRPELEKEIEIVHKAGKPFVYIMVTGVMPMLPELASMTLTVW